MAFSGLSLTRMVYQRNLRRWAYGPLSKLRKVKEFMEAKWIRKLPLLLATKLLENEVKANVSVSWAE